MVIMQRMNNRYINTNRVKKLILRYTYASIDLVKIRVQNVQMRICSNRETYTSYYNATVHQ